MRNCNHVDVENNQTEEEVYDNHQQRLVLKVFTCVIETVVDHPDIFNDIPKELIQVDPSLINAQLAKAHLLKVAEYYLIEFKR